ncbi:hypothetical protein ILYODFUR_013197 [Ilyodon furcidens]|uniref:Uncharacterized protein n=1 Tax=Ilyodon furcidens TaxID=33524 RepID=A0ABV0V2P4_9TELE
MKAFTSLYNDYIFSPNISSISYFLLLLFTLNVGYGKKLGRSCSLKLYHKNLSQKKHLVDPKPVCTVDGDLLRTKELRALKKHAVCINLSVRELTFLLTATVHWLKHY